MQNDIENLHRNLGKVMEERNQLKVDLRAVQIDTDREISQFRVSNQTKLEMMTEDLRN